MTDLGATIDRICAHEASDRLVAAYLDTDNGFAAATFDTFGENPETAISSEDLLAVTLLDVRFQPTAMRLLTDPASDVRRALDRHLGELDAEATIWAADADQHEAAEKAYWALRGLPGVGRVKTSKLLARKRPNMVPVRDRVVDRVLGLGDEYWAPLGEALADPDRRARLDRLGGDAACDVSTLRQLDIAVWMWGSRSRRAQSVRASIGVTETTWATDLDRLLVDA